MGPALLSLLFLLPAAAVGGVFLWLRQRRPKPNPQLPRPHSRPRPQLPSAATQDPSLLAALRGEHDEPLLCTTCRREYEENFRYCPYDSSPLLSQSRAQDLPSGMVCPRCQRGFEPGVKSCSHDGEELIPYSLFCATHGERLELSEDDLGKICPSCTNKYQGTASFCGRDGTELVLMN